LVIYQSLLIYIIIMKRADETANKNYRGVSSWQKRPSEIRGYKTCYYLTDKKKDYIRVDVNQSGKKVRLYIEVFKEGGCPYFSSIVDGKVVMEKNMFARRSSGFSNVFSERASIVSTLPDEDAIKLFGGNYGINSPETLQTKEVERKELLKETKKRYFGKEDISEENTLSDTEDGGKKPFFKGFFRGLIEVFLGAALSVSFFFIFGYSFTAFGVCLALYGAVLGGVDFFIRKKAPNVFKLLLFLITGSASYIYGYYII